ncbi:hypothetical protein Ccrd_018581, partial [Cynara cardunculus var. scolymus]
FAAFVVFLFYRSRTGGLWHRDLCRYKFPLTLVLSYVNISFVDIFNDHSVYVNIPIVLCGKQVTFHGKKNLWYYEISTKSNYNFEKPFLYLGRKLAGLTIIKLYSRKRHEGELAATAS